MPKKRKNEDAIFIRGLINHAETIAAIEAKHRISPVELGRGLIEAACRFYEEHGFFSFPVVINPEAFQQQWVAESQSPYQVDSSKVEKPPKTLDKSKRPSGARHAYRLPKSA